MRPLTAGMLFAFMLQFNSQAAAEDPVLFRDEFQSLAGWETLTFPKVERTTRYELEKDPEGSSTILKMYSERSSSALVSRREFNPREFPIVRWRWRTSTDFSALNPRKKSGDDYAIRVYVMFQIPEDQKSFSEKMGDLTARAVYGSVPPHGTLSYVWAGESFPDSCLVSPYTDRVELLALRKGPSGWQEESVDLAADYNRCFHEELPSTAQIAVMSDSDNSASTAEAALSYIEVRRR